MIGISLPVPSPAVTLSQSELEDAGGDLYKLLQHIHHQEELCRSSDLKMLLQNIADPEQRGEIRVSDARQPQPGAGLRGLQEVQSARTADVHALPPRLPPGPRPQAELQM